MIPFAFDIEAFHLHLAGKGLDVERERLQGNLVNASLLVFLLEELARLVGTALGIAATLILRAGQFFHNSLVVRHVLRTCLHTNGKHN